MKKTFVWITALMAVFSINSVAQTKDDAIRKTLNERYESAETDFQELIAREPSNGELYHAAGDNYFYWGEIEKSEAMFRKGIEMAPNNPLNYAGLGRVAWYNNNEAVNVAQFEKATTIMNTRSNKVPKPLQQLTYLKMAEVYLQSEKVLTVGALVKLLESEPNDEDLLAFGLEDKKAWASLKDSIVSQVGKKLNLTIIVKE